MLSRFIKFINLEYFSLPINHHRYIYRSSYISYKCKFFKKVHTNLSLLLVFEYLQVLACHFAPYALMRLRLYYRNSSDNITTSRHKKVFSRHHVGSRARVCFDNIDSLHRSRVWEACSCNCVLMRSKDRCRCSFFVLN